MMVKPMEIKNLNDYNRYKQHVSYIDLHGLAIQQGYQLFNKSITEAYFNGQKKITVITGQGMMMKELPAWCCNNLYVRDFVQQKHNPGSFTIKLKKRVDK